MIVLRLVIARRVTLALKMELSRQPPARRRRRGSSRTPPNSGWWN